MFSEHKMNVSVNINSTKPCLFSSSTEVQHINTQLLKIDERHGFFQVAERKTSNANNAPKIKTTQL